MNMKEIVVLASTSKKIQEKVAPAILINSKREAFRILLEINDKDELDDESLCYFNDE